MAVLKEGLQSEAGLLQSLNTWQLAFCFKKQTNKQTTPNSDLYSHIWSYKAF